MEGYSSDNVSAFTSTITSSVSDSLSNITMEGYNPNTDNLSAHVTAGASAGVTFSLGSDNVSGTYYYIWGGATPTGGCINDSAALENFSEGSSPQVPTTAASMKLENFLISSTSAAEKYSYYSDNSCATLMGYHQYNVNNIKVGSVVDNLTTGSSRPSSAYQVSFEYKDIITKAVANDTPTLSFLNTLVGMTHSLDVEKITPNSGKRFTIWAIQTINGRSFFYSGTQNYSLPYPTNWTTYDGILVKDPSDTTAPTVSLVSTTADNQSSVAITDNITVTFSEAMVPSYINTGTSDTFCAGSIQVSSVTDNFSSGNCIRMSSDPVSSNSNMTWTLDPVDNLTAGTTYLIRVTTAARDTAGNAMSSQYDNSTGFTTVTASSSSSSSSVFIVVGRKGGAAGQAAPILKSADGITWDNVSSQTLGTLNGVAFGNNTFVAVGDSNAGIVRSTDNGSSFDNATSPTLTTLSGVTFGNNTFVAVGGSGNIVRSTDNGSSFDNATVDNSTASDLSGVTFGNNTFVAVGAGGNIVRSTDNGSSWDNATNSNGNSLNGVTFVNNTFVAVGQSGNIVRSTNNGSSWDNVTSPTANHLNGVTFGNNTFVAVGDVGAILTSSDGVTWATRTSGSSTLLWSVGFGNNTFVVTGNGGTILTSSDGASWTTRTSGREANAGTPTHTQFSGVIFQE